MKRSYTGVLSIVMIFICLFSCMPVYAFDDIDFTSSSATEEEASESDPIDIKSDSEDGENAVEDIIDIELPELDDDTVTSGDFEYKVLKDNSGVSITKYVGAGGVITIPSTLDDYTVVELSNYAFYDTSIIGVTIPGTVVNIGSSAFSNCNQLLNVTIDNEATELVIGSGAFCNCELLQKIALPDCVTEIPSQFAYGCGQLEEVVWPKELVSIGDDAFNKAKWLKNADLSDTKLSKIGKNAFNECASLQVVIFPQVAPLAIGNNAFENSGMISDGADGELVIPQNVTSIGENAFSRCDHLGKVVFESGTDIIGIGNQAFAECENLKTIILSERVTSIPSGFAMRCKDLTDVTWTENILSIGDNAFNEDDSLVSSDLSGTKVAKIGGYAFGNCTRFPMVILPADRKISISGGAFYNTAMGSAGEPGELVIGANILEIGTSAFSNCKYLEKVVFEEGDESIMLNDGIFKSCPRLKAITLSKRISVIPPNFASDAEALETVLWPETLEKIDSGAFGRCKKLVSSDFSKTQLQKIGSGAFASCEKLPVITFPTDIPIVIGSSAFSGSGMEKDGDTGTLVIPSNVVEIEYWAFYNCSKLGKVVFEDGDSFITMGDGIFEACKELNVISFGNRIKSIPSHFAASCSRLVQLIGGPNISDITKGAFSAGKSEIVLTNCNDVIKNYDWESEYRCVVDAAVTVALKEKYVVEVGKTIDLKPIIKVFPEGAKQPELKWRSVFAAWISVDNKGRVKGLNEGADDVLVETKNGILKAECIVTVVKKGEAPTPSPDEVENQIIGSGEPIDSQPVLTNDVVQSLTLVKGQKFFLVGDGWKSSSKCVKISKGKVSAKSIGNAILSGNGQTINVTVIQPSLQKKLQMVVGEEKQIKPVGLNDLPFVMTCSKTDVIHVESDGTIYAIAKGNAVIVAYVNGVAYKCTVKVSDIDSSKKDYTQNTKPIVLAPLQSVKITAKGFKAKNAKWQSDRVSKTEGLGKGVVFEDDIVRITDKGKIMAIGVGTTNLTTTGGGLELSFSITVNEPVVKSINLNLNSSKTVKLYGVKGPIVWKPIEGEDSSIVTVEKGRFTAVKAGEATFETQYESFIYRLNVCVEDPSIKVDGGFSGKLYKYSIDISAGQTVGINYYAVYQDLLLRSDKCYIAYADSDGIIHARSKGTAKLSGVINGKTVTIIVRVQ